MRRPAAGRRRARAPRGAVLPPPAAVASAALEGLKGPPQGSHARLAGLASGRPCCGAGGRPVRSSSCPVLAAVAGRAPGPARCGQPPSSGHWRPPRTCEHIIDAAQRHDPRPPPKAPPARLSGRAAPPFERLRVAGRSVALASCVCSAASGCRTRGRPIRPCTASRWPMQALPAVLPAALAPIIRQQECMRLNGARWQGLCREGVPVGRGTRRRCCRIRRCWAVHTWGCCSACLTRRPLKLGERNGNH